MNGSDELPFRSAATAEGNALPELLHPELRPVKPLTPCAKKRLWLLCALGAISTRALSKALPKLLHTIFKTDDNLNEPRYL